MPDQYHIRRITTGDDAFALCDPEGNPVPNQVRTSLTSQAGGLPIFTVEFEASKTGLQVVDTRDS